MTDEERWESWEDHLDWLAEEYLRGGEDCEGRTLEDIAEDVGVSMATVSRRLDDAGVVKRDPGRKPRA